GGFGAPPAAEPQPATQEGADPGGADPAARRSGAQAAGGHGFRGRALDRSDFARIARPYRRARAQPAGAPLRDLSPRVPAARDRAAARDGIVSKTSRSGRERRTGPRAHRQFGGNIE